MPSERQQQSIRDGVRDLAALIAETKREYKLTENTVLRIVDTTLAIADKQGAFNRPPQAMPTDEELAESLGITPAELNDEAGTESMFELNGEGIVENPVEGEPTDGVAK